VRPSVASTEDCPIGEATSRGIRTEGLEIRRLGWFLLLAFGLPWLYWWLVILEVIKIPGLANEPDGDLAFTALLALLPLVLSAQFCP